jgi:hypothetical protein
LIKCSTQEKDTVLKLQLEQNQHTMIFGAIKPKWLTKSQYQQAGKSEWTDQDEEEYGLLSHDRRRSGNFARAAILSLALLVFVVLSAVNVAAIVNRLTKTPDHKVLEAEFIELSMRPTRTQHDSQSTTTEIPTPWDCGRTVESAISLGCPFDVTSNLWTPPRCYDPAFALEALQGVDIKAEHGGIGAPEFGLGGFEWYEDPELSRRIHTAHDLEQFLLRRDQEGLPLDAYTHMSFHAAHCSYLARVATQGLDRVTKGETDVWIPEVATNPSHARHCEHVFGELFRLGQDGPRRNWTEVGFGIAPCVRID